MAFFIGTNGKIYKEGFDHDKFDTEKYGILNWFKDRYVAYTVRDIIEEYNPTIFMLN